MISIRFRGCFTSAFVLGYFFLIRFTGFIELLVEEESGVSRRGVFCFDFGSGFGSGVSRRFLVSTVALRRGSGGEIGRAFRLSVGNFSFRWLDL